MKYKLLFIFFVALFNSGIYGQTVIIGSVPSFAGKTITLIKYKNFINYSLEIVSKAKISNDSGVFKFEINTKETLLTELKIGNLRAQLYIEPNKTYHVSLTDIAITNNDLLSQDTYIKPAITEEQYPLNKQISEFNTNYDKFVSKNLALFVTKRAKKRVDTFVVDIQNNFAQDSTIYFKNYLKYNLGVMQLSAFISKKKIYENLIENQPILYHNDGYMYFFNQFYSQYFKTISITDQESLIKALTINMSYSELMIIFNKNPYLQNDTLREFVLIKALYENYNYPRFSHKSILHVLQHISTKGLNQQNRLIAKDISSHLKGTSIGNFAPDFAFQNTKGETVTLKQLKGKYIYLDFWATWCLPCIQEMKLIPNLKKKYGKHIQFVSISIDKKKKLMDKFVKKNKYDWTFLYAGKKDEKTIEDYKIKSIPLFYLIDPKGKIIQSPALRPSTIESTFKKLTHRKNRNRGQWYKN